MAMPQRVRALETRPLVNTPSTAASILQDSISQTARSGAAPLDNHTMDEAEYAIQSVHGHRLDWDEIPLRTPGKKDKPLR